MDAFGCIINCTCTPGDPVKSNIEILKMLLKLYNGPEVRLIPTWEITVKVFFYVVAFILDVVGNTMIVLIILLNKRMRSTTNILILNLAVSDIMVGLFCMWVHLGNQITVNWPFGVFVCKVNFFIQVLAVTCSVLTLTVISIERFFAIVFPLRGKMSTTVTAISIGTCWLVSAGIASPHLAIRKHVIYHWKDRDEIFCTEDWPKYYTSKDCESGQPGRTIYYTVEGVVMYFIPVVVMIAAYTVISLKLLLRKAPGNNMRSTTSSQDRTRKKVIKMLIVVLVVFILCWTPQQTLLLWDIYRSHNTGKAPPDFIKTIKYVAVYAAYLNSAINPILYAGFNDNFRKGFTEAFKCNLWKNRNHVAPGRSAVTAVEGSKVGESSAGRSAVTTVEGSKLGESSTGVILNSQP